MKSRSKEFERFKMARSPFSRQFLRLFILGFCVGVLVTYILVSFLNAKPVTINFDIDIGDKHHKYNLARDQANASVKVLCLVMSTPTTVNSNGKSVKETWGKRCDKLFLNENGKSGFTGAWQHILNNYLNDIDWFLNVNDDNFVILENLWRLVSPLNPEKPYYLGRRSKGEYCMGSAGYVFSRETLRSFGRLLKDSSKCVIRGERNLDIAVGKCLSQAGIHPIDTRDSRGRQKFHPVSPAELLAPGILKKDSWLSTNDFYPFQDGPECCSDNSITYRVTSSNAMYIMEYFVYHLMPFLK